MALSDSPQPVTARTGTSQGVFGFNDLIRVGGEHGQMILAVATCIVAITLVVLVLWPTSYSSSAVVMLDPQTNAVLQNSAVLTAQPTDPASVQNQIQILTSRDIAAQVIANLKLNADTEFSKPALFTGEMPTRDEIIDTFEKHLTVAAIGLSTSFNVTVSSREPEKAAKIANAVANAYLQDQVNTENEAARSTTDWLLARIQVLADQVQRAETAVQQYKAVNNLNDTSEGTSLVDQQLIGVSAALVAAKSDMAEKEANANHVRFMLKGGQADDVSQVVASPLMVQLRTQEADILQKEAQLAVRYGQRNPKFIDIESQKQNLEDKIAQEATRISGAAGNDVSVARANVASLQYSLSQLEKKETVQGLARVRLKALEANAASTRTEYEAFVTRLRETQGGVEMPNARIISHAAIPTRPSSPKRTLIAAASIPAGLLIGLLIALFAERSGSVVRFSPIRFQILEPKKKKTPQAPPTVDPLRGATVIGEIPDHHGIGTADLIMDRPTGDYTRRVDALLDQVAEKDNNTGKIVALMAPDPGESKSVLAASLARAAAQRGSRVIVIDGNVEAPKVAMAMGLPTTTRGLYDVLSGSAALSECLTQDSRSPAMLLPPGLTETSEAMLTQVMPMLVEHLRNTFDLVILDCPQPANGEVSRYLLAFSDVALLLVGWRTTPRTRVSQTLDTLATMSVPATGIVFAR